MGGEVTWYLFDRVMTWLNRNDIISLLTDNNNNNLLLHWKDRLHNDFFHILLLFVMSLKLEKNKLSEKLQMKQRNNFSLI